MANKDYELFCETTIPGLTLLDRQILGHYCARYNKDKGKAWPSMEELLRITGVKHRESIDRSRGRLVDLGFLIRVTPGYRGQQAEFAINLKLIESYISVTEQLHINKEQVTVELQEITERLLTSNRAVGIEYPSGYSKRIKPNKPINVNKDHVVKNQSKNKYEINYERWQVVTSYIDENARKLINPAPNSELLLDECQGNGYSPTAIRDHVGRINYSTAGKVGGVFIDALRTLAGVKKPTVSSSMPEWCGDENCDQETRTFPEASLINDKMTNNCSKCHPLMQRARPPVTKTSKDYESFFRSPD
jgi:hypothetical protein